MSRSRAFALVGLLSTAAALVGTSPAFAAHTYLEARNSGSTLYAVTPAMMHAIDVIVAEKMKMRAHRR